jgi:hypothetical protein
VEKREIDFSAIGKKQKIKFAVDALNKDNVKVCDDVEVEITDTTLPAASVEVEIKSINATDTTVEFEVKAP